MNDKMGDGEEADYVIVGGGSAGCVLAARLSEDPGVRVLFSSGYSNDYHDLADIPQIVGYIQKPYRVEELANKVREILDRVRQHKKD